MLETMLVLKNSDVQRIPGCEPEPVEKLRKLLRGEVSSLWTWTHRGRVGGSWSRESGARPGQQELRGIEWQLCFCGETL